MYLSEFHLQVLLWTSPAILLAMAAQFLVRSTYMKARRIPASSTGYAAARHILDAHGLNDVRVEQTPGFLTDHYSPAGRVLRLSPDVFQGRTLAAVGIAAHEAGHALQHAQRYAPLVIRNLAAPMASFGATIGMSVAALAVAIAAHWLLLVGIALFSFAVFFQVVNLPVEFDASARAKRELVERGIVAEADMGPVRSVLYAAALTYVAVTLQNVLTLVVLVLHALQRSRR